MTKQEREIMAMDNEELVGAFDVACTTLTHEENSRRGITKKSERYWQDLKKELLRRLEG